MPKDKALVAPKSLSQVVESTTTQYLSELDLENLPQPSDIEAELIYRTNAAINLANVTKNNDEKFNKLRSLSFYQVAQILLTLHGVIKIAPSGKNTDPDYDLLALYCDSGEQEGIYLTAEHQIRSIARRYDKNLRTMDFKEVLAILQESAPRLTRCDDPDLIAVANGIYNYKTKKLQNFDPKYIFLSKSLVPYDPNAKSPILIDPEGNPWELEEWMHTLSDDQEIIDLLWQVLGAIIRPNVSWNKSAWFYSEVGNNGKGTIVELMRNLCGPGSYASLPLSDMGKDFMLEPLTRANAIITDENDVGQYIDKAANLKAIITNDVLMINRKHKSPISYQFRGFMVQCLNEFPRIKDKSDSFHRRQLFIPFTKCFTGREKKWIKDEFMSHPEVLRYTLRRVLELTPDYWSFSEPEATKQVLDEYKEWNDPVRSFWNELKDEFVWDLLPFNFLYSLFRVWFTQNNPSGMLIGKNSFIKDLNSVLNEDTDWSCQPTTLIRSNGRMNVPEPLIETYGLKDWQQKNYNGRDVARRCSPVLATSYRGVLRTVATLSNSNSSTTSSKGDIDE